MELKVTFNLLPILAVVISLLAWYIPKFKDWYNALASEKKQLLMIGIIFVVDLVVVLLSLLNFLHIYTGTTWQEWVWYPLVDFVAAVIANASTYKATNYLLGPKEQG